MITYDYYRIFYFVARYKSFTKAAKNAWQQSAQYYTLHEYPGARIKMHSFPTV